MAVVRDYLHDPGKLGEIFDAHLATQASEIADSALPALRLSHILHLERIALEAEPVRTSIAVGLNWCR